MRNICYLLLIGCALFLLFNVAFGNDCKSYCEDAFKSCAELDQTICKKAQEIQYTLYNLGESDEVEALGQKMKDTYPAYINAKKTIGVANFLFDFTTAFSDAGIDVPGYTHENAARVVTAGKEQLEAVEAILDGIADEVRKILDPDKET